MKQSTLFGSEAPKRKAKALPKLTPAPVVKLDELLRDANLAKVQAYRAKQQIGDIRIADRECSACGGELIEELVSIHDQGGRYYEAICLKCHPSE